VSGFGADDSLDRQAMDRLERAVTRLLQEVDVLRLKSARGEQRVREMESLLRRFSKGQEDPVRLQSRVDALTEENERLRARIREGLEGVERLLARIQFLEDQV
jgi:predicted RNase H-like nuclease (RuvC/YqgF family)